MILNPITPSEQVLYATVRIEYTNPNTTRPGFGTAFILNLNPPKATTTVPVLVTNKHVIQDAEEGTISFHRAQLDNNGNRHPAGIKVTKNIPDFKPMWINHPDESVDLCFAPLAPIVILMEQEDPPVHIFYRALGLEMLASDEDLLSDCSAAEEVLMYGYPIGVHDERNNFPLIRRGITASHPGIDFNGKTVGAVDIACFPGSSGSPILILREGAWFSKKRNAVTIGGKGVLLGVLYGGEAMRPDGTVDIISIPMQNQILTDKRMLVMHLGYYVKAKELYKLCDALALKFPDSAQFLNTALNDGETAEM